jgi:hypothetical protein
MINQNLMGNNMINQNLMGNNMINQNLMGNNMMNQNFMGNMDMMGNQMGMICPGMMNQMGTTGAQTGVIGTNSVFLNPFQ